MLGFSGAICAVQYAHFGQGAYGSPIWMDNLRCTGYETELRRCPFHGWGHHDCGHYEDAGVVCVDGEGSLDRDC